MERQNNKADLFMLHHLIYSSCLCNVSFAELEAIEQQSRVRNAENGISGFLIHGGDTAFQVLEGPRSAVSQTLFRIANDPRHTDVVILLAEDIDQRYFGFTPMTFIDVEKQHKDIVAQYLEGETLDTHQLGGHAVWDMIERVAECEGILPLSA